MEKNEIALNVEQDLNEISRLIWDYVDKKYIVTLKGKLDGYRSECEANLCKEAQLLQAIMPFMPEERGVLQLMIDAIVYNDVIEKSLEEHHELQRFYRDENKKNEQIKKLVYKLVMVKLIQMVENVSRSAEQRTND